MNHLRRIAALGALSLMLSLSLTGCSSGPKQEAAASPEEAAVHFLTNLQNGEFDMAKTYLGDGNPLLYVLPASEGEETAVPEMEEIYRQFCGKMSGMTFRVADGEVVGNSMVYIAAKQYQFASAIRAAMLEAMQTQCQGGGDAFADYIGWISQGIANAELGEEETIRATASQTKGSYTIDHRSYTDHDFMNLITGGFYDYADFQMAVCTGSIDGVDYNYYFAALGDEIVACVQESTEVDDTGELDDETLAEMNEFYAEYTQETPGIYIGFSKDGNRVTMRTGIDFATADQNALVNAGLVSGKYQGNMVNGWLSLASTISGFERDGMTCVVTPAYPAED